MAQPKIKIIFYDGKGRAEISRLIMAAGGIPWEDVIITNESWKTEQAKTPFGQLPVMEIDGQRFAQYIAMASYVAKEAGLYGKNNLMALKIDQVVQLAVECVTLAIRALHESDPTKKAELLRHYDEVDTQRYFTMYEQLLKESGTGYFVGDSLSLADLFVYDQVFTPSKWKTYKTDGFPLLLALQEKVENNDKIKTYLANRKETDF